MTATATPTMIGHAEVLALTYDLMEQHLDTRAWRFRWNNRHTAVGVCKHDRPGGGHIEISRPLTAQISVEQARDTILHEIAHAIAGRQAGHGPLWRKIHRSIGGSAARTVPESELVVPPKPFTGTCPNCGHTKLAYRRTYIACGACCRRHNQGKFIERYVFVWTRTA